MKGQQLKIIFKEDMAFLTEEVALDFKQVEISDRQVRFKASAFWTIRVINYIEAEKKLFVEVLDYQVGETQFSFEQIQLADTLVEIEKVTFKTIDTFALLKTLNSTDPIKALPPKHEIIYRQEASIQSETQIEREPVKQIYTEPFSIPIKDVTFFNGSVVFEKKIQQLQKSIKFQILNENIIEEYDSIKNYFASVLKTKRIQVAPTIITVNGIITSIDATSNEIEKINKTLIEEVKFELVNVARKKEAPVDKELFTVNEYFETFIGEDFKTQQIFKDDTELFETLLERSKTKHHAHLRFLSSRHNTELAKLRLVQKPFSFVFLLGGIDRIHIVWETLDTEEATYIWTVANDSNNVQQILMNTDKTIHFIVRDGKNEYVGRHEENFKRVFHDYSNLQDGFISWKKEIEKIIL